MSAQFRRADGARVLADLNALRAFGRYKTGVHRPTFSEAHRQSLSWLAERLRQFVDENPDFEVPVERLATWLARLDDDDE